MVSQKPWRLESFLWMLVRLFACFAAGMVVVGGLRRWLGDQTVEDLMLNVVVATLCFQVAVLVLIGFFLHEYGMGWTEAFGFKNEPGWAILLGISAAVLAVPAAWWLQEMAAQFFSQLGFKVGEQDTVELLRETHSLWKPFYLGVFTIVLAPLAEEMFFRGICYPLLKQAGFPRLALWGTALLFAVIHGNLAAFVPLMFLAVVLTLLYEWTNNLLTCIVVHSLFNAANFALLFMMKNAMSLPGNP